ncbi:MAG: VOC family protein [Eggerthellaceae bacterium]|nr:VOC family protein [Eggerthellaceae bacterium]
MFETIMNKYGPDQLSYYVEDIDAACERFHEMFGAGPFIKMGPMKFEKCVYRGKEIDVEFELALGMWGDIEVEFVHRISGDHYLLEEHGFGFNHVNVIVDDYDEAIKLFASYGIEPGMEMISSGKPVAYMETMALLGHNVEIHGPQSSAIPLCKAAKAAWDGESTFIDVAEVMKLIGRG